MRALVTGCASTPSTTTTSAHSSSPTWSGPGSRTFEHVPVDLAMGDLSEFVSECDVVFHLAAEPGVRSSWRDRFERYVRNNVLATQRLPRGQNS